MPNETISDVLDLLRKIRLEVLRGDLSTKQAHKLYNKTVNKYRNKLWRQYIRPTVEGTLDADWMDEFMDAMLILDILLRRR
jgi:hypothetical protein